MIHVCQLLHFVEEKSNLMLIKYKKTDYTTYKIQILIHVRLIYFKHVYINYIIFVSIDF